MKNDKPLLYLLFFLLIFACTPTQQISGPKDDGQIEIVFLHINDVYEIAPLEGGKVGGMARLATLRKQLLAQNKNTLTVHAGDFLNPSLIGTLKYNGERIKGRQMVETMNACGVDLATFGNHEFDIAEDELQKRLNESRFAWTSANVLQNVCGRLYPFYCERDGKKNFVPETYIYEASDADGTQIKIGIFGVTLPSNPQDFVHYEDVTTEALKAYEKLSKETDVVIGLTHLEIDQDLELSKKLPGVPLIMGGHDHDHMLHTVGENIVAKADANVKTAYVHRLQYNRTSKKSSIKSELVPINESIKADPVVDALVEKWNTILLENIKEFVPNPTEVIYVATVPLDGRESQNRYTQTNLGKVITQSMIAASSEGATAAILNSGSIRIDDQISGEVTPVDIFRAMPYGGSIFDVTITGDLLGQILDYGDNRKGNGAYLQRGNITRDAGGTQWLINEKPIKKDQNYKIMVNDYLLTGKDIPLMKSGSPGMIAEVGPAEGDKGPKSDIRIATINYLKTL